MASVIKNLAEELFWCRTQIWYK